MKSVPRNIPASVRARLLNLSKTRQEDFNRTLSRFVSERFLFRLGESRIGNEYVLKGAMLLAAVLDAVPYRPTRDIDVLRSETADTESILADLEAVCSIVDRSDGLVFHATDAVPEDIRENNRYHGVRVKIPVRLENARVPLQIDVGFGDAVTPAPQVVRIEPLLDHDPPVVRAYPLQTVVAEKLEAIVSVGMATSRMKDFFDLYTIASWRRFDRRELLESIEATFRRRGTPLPMELPVVLGEAMPKDSGKQAQWAAFVRRVERTPSELQLDTVIATIRDFTRIAWDRRLNPALTTWSPADGWHRANAAKS